jgi:CDP-diacylglycerol---serine O-phosphatidyltransferase
MKPIRTVSVFPTMFTLGNLVCGFFAIVVASRIDARHPAAIDPTDPTNVMLSAWLIFLAIIFDALDGYVARLANSASQFGAELDSLADLVTFGVAPAFLLVKMCPQFAYLHREATWVIAAAFVACAALRLARFNVETGDEDDHLTFTGLPSPAAAAAVASFAILFYTLRREVNPVMFAAQIDGVLQAILPPFALLMALLMVSRIPYPHVVNQVFRGQRSFGHVVAVVFALVAVMVVRGYAVPLVCCAFALSGPVRYVWLKALHRREREEPLF